MVRGVRNVTILGNWFDHGQRVVKRQEGRNICNVTSLFARRNFT
jgi:hypothetical protein